MSKIFVGSASAIALLLSLSGPAWAGSDASPAAAAQPSGSAQASSGQTTAGGQGGSGAEAGSGKAMTAEGTVSCPPGAQEPICRNQGKGAGASDTGTTASGGAPQEGTVPPDTGGMAMTAGGFEGAVVSDSEENPVGTVVEVMPGSDGQTPERFVIELDDSGKRVALDASEVEVGDNMVKLTGQTVADLEQMPAHEGSGEDATAEGAMPESQAPSQQ